MSLHTLQQNLAAWLTGESAEVAARFGESARAGLAVYLNNYRAQLRSCLSTSFPVVHAWIGDTAFEAAASKHIESVPPHAWTLDAYALDFPETLASLYPTDPEIAELARLERELTTAFVGTDAEPVAPSALTDIDWDAAIIRFVPTLALLTVTTNVAAIWSAINAHETPPSATRSPEPVTLVVWRDDFSCRFRTATAEEAAAFAQVLEGETFGGMCAALAARLGEQQGATVAAALLSGWLSERLIARISAGAPQIAIAP